MDNAFLGKTIENVRTHRVIKLVTLNQEGTIQQLNKIIMEHFFSENSLAIKNKTQILMNRPAYLGLLTLDFKKLVTYEFWYDYMKPKYGEKANYVT